MIRLLVTLALRSVWAHKVKNCFVGSILFFGTFLVVAGSALLGSVERAMEASLTSSLAGHLQVYAKDAKDELSVFGSFGLGAMDIGEIDPFADAERDLLAIDNVAVVVPMGITTVSVFGRTSLDKVLEQLRWAVRDGQPTDDLAARVRQIGSAMVGPHEAAGALRSDKEKFQEEQADLRRALSDDFWHREFVQDPYASLDFLDSRVAPLTTQAESYYLSVVGTDPAQFGDAFSSFYVVQGQAIPEGRPGFLFSNRTYERLVKHKVARGLDRIHEAVVVDGERIADDPMLKEEVRLNRAQYKRLVYDLKPADAARVHDFLRGELGRDGSFEELLQAFLDVTDDTVARRHQQFYEQIAPHIPLYDPKIGEDITLRAFTRTGYMRSINVPIYGTYEFTGLEKSDIWTAFNIADLVTFRQLYGKMSDREQQELADIRVAAGVEAVSRDEAEAALFGAADAEVVAVEASTFDDAFAVPDHEEKVEYSRSEIRDGLALNAAILLKDPERLEETQADVQALIDENGLNLQVVDWQTASGFTGQYITVMRVVLYVALGIIFGVAMIIVNNAMVTATLDRTPEIGTMRAIGAQRSVVLALIVAETLALGVIAGGQGAVAGALLIAWLGQVGIPAPGEAMVMLFAGPELYPSLSAWDLVFGMGTVVVAGVLSSLYPAFVATRVSPIVAMQATA